MLASATLAIDAQPAAAEIYRPWCVQYGGNDGDNGTTCAFTSFEQCMMTARGGGGFCIQNPSYYAPMWQRPEKARRPLDEATGPSGADCGPARPWGEVIGATLGVIGACNTPVTPCNTPLVPYKDNHASVAGIISIPFIMAVARQLKLRERKQRVYERGA